MPTLPNMGLILPAPGDDSGTWDDKINACFGQVDEHDHTDGQGLAITVAALDIDDDLPMGGNGLTGVGRVDFNAVTTLAAGANVLFVDSGDGELYWRTTGGANVKLTAGSSINTTLVGGIVGDYSSVGAEVAYDDANKTYTFKDENGSWARLGSGPVRIYQYTTSESVYVEHAVATALAAPYTITWPAALPATTAAELWADASGNVSFSAPQRTRLIPALGGDSTAAFGTVAGQVRTGASGGVYWRAIEIQAGERIVNVRVRIKDNVAGTTVTATVYRDEDGVTSTIATLGPSAGDGTFQTLSVGGVGVNHTVTTGGTYLVAFTFGGSAANCDLHRIEIDYDRPTS